MSGRVRTWTRVHERVQDMIDLMADLKVPSKMLPVMDYLYTELTALQTQLETLDVNYRPCRETQVEEAVDQVAA